MSGLLTIKTLEIVHLSTHFMTIPIAVFSSWWYGKRYGYSVKKSISYGVLLTLLVVLFTYACKWIPGWLGYTVFLNSYRSFLFIPVFALFMCKAWGIPTLEGMDFVTPIMFLERTVVLVGCTLLGCGLAVECDWGTYNHALGCRVFPMDLIDLIANFAVTILSLAYAKRLEYKGNGRIFVFAMYLQSVVRLFIQFGSRECWWGIKGFNDESVYSIIAIILAIMIYLRNRKTDRNQSVKQ